MQRNFLTVTDTASGTTPDGSSRPAVWLGANFWSRVGGPLMWRHYDATVVREELRTLAAHGLNVTRSFLYWPDFQPAPGVIDEAMVAHLHDFLAAHRDAGLRTIPTFIVGHMSGQNWDPSWRGERDLYSDVWLVARQAWFAAQIVARIGRDEAIAGWLLSNEMPIYGRPPHLRLPAAPAEQVTAWAQLLRDAIRANGGTQPISTGDGVWGTEMTGVDNGFGVRELAPLQDFLGPHVYRMETDLVRQHLSAAFACELAGFVDRPVVLEEFGVTTDFVSDVNAGHYYRQTLHSSLLAGATGWLAWNNTDYDDLADQEPYSHHPFEQHFGITDSTGAPKAPLIELQAFRAVLDEVDLARCRRPDVRAVIVVPAVLETAVPFTEPDDHTDPVHSLRQAFVASREADLPIAFSREVDGITADADLYLVPSLKQLTGPTWRRLAERAAQGATVYVSCFAGSHETQRGSWAPDLNRFAGVEHQLHYGLAETVPAGSVEITFVADFGEIPAATVLTFAVAGSPSARSMLPVVATDARVVAVDPFGRPALVVRETGAGRIVLATYPFEFLAAQQPHVNPEPTYRLYDALAGLAGIGRDVTVADPRVHVGELARDDGSRFIWFISQAEAAMTVKAQVADGWRLHTADGPASPEFELAPFGVSVRRLERLGGAERLERAGGAVV